VIKAVFFDWFSTLAHYDPPRAQLQAQVLRELGFNVSQPVTQRALVLADKTLYAELAEISMRNRTPEERLQVYLRHQQSILDNAGIDSSTELAERTFRRMRELNTRPRFVLFDDVLPTVRMLKERQFIIGLLTNIHRGINDISKELGLEPFLDFIASSEEAGADKPDPAIFRFALERARADPAETVHVGDQYLQDVTGARNVGITPVFIDRFDVSPEVTDCARIRNLTELPAYLN
jgi:HAD superfamily hydrolase (TIGR01549 family)